MTRQKQRGGEGRKPLEGRLMSQDVGRRDMLRLMGLWRRSEREVSLSSWRINAGRFVHKGQRKDLNSRA